VGLGKAAKQKKKNKNKNRIDKWILNGQKENKTKENLCRYLPQCNNSRIMSYMKPASWTSGNNYLFPS
jgi:hypothetical protein